VRFGVKQSTPVELTPVEPPFSFEQNYGDRERVPPGIVRFGGHYNVASFRQHKGNMIVRFVRIA